MKSTNKGSAQGVFVHTAGKFYGDPEKNKGTVNCTYIFNTLFFMLVIMSQA